MSEVPLYDPFIESKLAPSTNFRVMSIPSTSPPNWGTPKSSYSTEWLVATPTAWWTFEGYLAHKRATSP